MVWWAWGLGAAALGGGAYLLWPSDGEHKKKHGRHDETEDAEQPSDQGSGDVTAAAATEAEQSNTPIAIPGSPAPSTPASTDFHPGPYILPQAAQAVSLRGPARQSAMQLYNVLSHYGTARTPQLHRLVLTFQRAHNSDALAIRLAGRLPRTGHFDARTAATLTMYTGQSIPPTVGAPRPPNPPFREILNSNIPGNAALAGFNLGTDLRNRGVIHDERQKHLIREYQREINRDPKFPGPAWARGTRPMIPQRLRENGRYSHEVARALSLQTHNVPLPPVV
jgi:hypothetical protein